MYYYVNGTVAEIDAGLAVIDCGGVGYACATTNYTLSQLKKGAPAKLYTYLNVREDAMELFGFIDQNELRSFKLLISVSGVGPRAALAILSAITPQQLALAVVTDDAKALTAAPGIGKKTAQHVFLELKYKLKVEDTPQAAALLVGGQPGSVFRDVLDGLANLGYAEEECAPLVKKLLHEEPDLDVTGALRAALKALARGRA